MLLGLLITLGVMMFVFSIIIFSAGFRDFVFAGFLMFFALMCFFGFYSVIKDKGHWDIKEYELASLSDNFGTSGYINASFLTTSGDISSACYYSYRYYPFPKNKNIISGNTIEASPNVYIVQGNYKPPVLKRYEYVCSNDFLAKKPEWWFFIPEGSVINSFRVDE